MAAASSRMVQLQSLTQFYTWARAPFIVSAPMRVLSGAHLAVAVSRAGGLGFIGPGADPKDTMTELDKARDLLDKDPLKTPTALDLLPVGVGFQTWNGNLDVASLAIEKHRPSAAWLFAPRHGQRELDDWTRGIRKVSPATRIWIQVGTLREAIDAAESSDSPDVLVIQGAEAGGHGRANDAIGLITLLPEIQDALRSKGIPLFAAGGIADGRGVTAALGLGAAGVVMGTRFLASTEARISKGYQDEILRAKDGASSTARTQLYNHLRGTFDWPEQFSPRTITNKSWEEHQEGVPFEKLKKRHDELLKKGDEAWGDQGRTATYAGANIGLIHEVKGAGLILDEVRREAGEIIRSLQFINQ
ncbi:hypothetical protein B0I35DRAFT_424485 [Stachybotrys elegans]|uniref:Nitronate monooxygenase domain-containing protein n=1 Tax=Stachybotrys elegans TaxID=80388 RepID=A0A8K0WTW7_9HYPO|nr:hypothetical protein B0I35DRAFT_424485 [Stachybotrys elegans]